MDGKNERRPSTTERGARAEAHATRLLVEAGYSIVERNYRCKSGELDVVARDGDVLVFVEVRSRADDEHGSAAETVRWGKQRRVIRAARFYLAERAPAYERCRFDVVALTGTPDGVDAVLLKDAFRV